MGSTLTVILIAVAAVAFFVAGLSLSIIIRGRHFDGDISTNKDMQRLGIKCPVREAREDAGTGDCDTPGCSGACSSCDIQHQSRTADSEQ